MDKYTVKMFPQAYRDLDQIYEQIALNSNYDSRAMDIVDQIEKPFLVLMNSPTEGQNVNEDFMPIKVIGSYLFLDILLFMRY